MERIPSKLKRSRALLLGAVFTLTNASMLAASYWLYLNSTKNLGSFKLTEPTRNDYRQHERWLGSIGAKPDDLGGMPPMTYIKSGEERVMILFDRDAHNGERWFIMPPGHPYTYSFSRSAPHEAWSVSIGKGRFPNMTNETASVRDFDADGLPEMMWITTRNAAGFPEGKPYNLTFTQEEIVRD
ncbi:MAG: hypothetical protein AAGB34_00020 [Planctomycetota bacterium]